MKEVKKASQQTKKCLKDVYKKQVEQLKQQMDQELK